MSLANTTPQPGGRVYTCKIAELIESDANPEGAAANVAKHMAGRHSNADLARWLNVNPSTVSKHRNGVCICGRDQ